MVKRAPTILEYLHAAPGTYPTIDRPMQRYQPPQINQMLPHGPPPRYTPEEQLAFQDYRRSEPTQLNTQHPRLWGMFGQAMGVTVPSNEGDFDLYVKHGPRQPDDPTQWLNSMPIGPGGIVDQAPRTSLADALATPGAEPVPPTMPPLAPMHGLEPPTAPVMQASNTPSELMQILMRLRAGNRPPGAGMQ